MFQVVLPPTKLYVVSKQDAKAGGRTLFCHLSFIDSAILENGSYDSFWFSSLSIILAFENQWISEAVFCIFILNTDWILGRHYKSVLQQILELENSVILLISTEGSAISNSKRFSFYIELMPFLDRSIENIHKKLLFSLSSRHVILILRVF